MLSRKEVKVEHKGFVAAFTSRDEKWVGEGREEDTTEERWEIETHGIEWMCVACGRQANELTWRPASTS